jgi:hypothetical protein
VRLRGVQKWPKTQQRADSRCWWFRGHGASHLTPQVNILALNAQCEELLGPDFKTVTSVKAFLAPAGPKQGAIKKPLLQVGWDNVAFGVNYTRRHKHTHTPTHPPTHTHTQTHTHSLAPSHQHTIDLLTLLLPSAGVRPRPPFQHGHADGGWLCRPCEVRVFRL